MKQRVEVVFSNGSKQMAHNNDELYERWMIRREQAAEQGDKVKAKDFIEIFIPDIEPDAPMTPQLLESLTEKQNFLGMQRADARLSATTDRNLTTLMRRNAIEAGMKRLHYQINLVQSKVKFPESSSKVQENPELSAWMRQQRDLLAQEVTTVNAEVQALKPFVDEDRIDSYQTMRYVLMKHRENVLQMAIRIDDLYFAVISSTNPEDAVSKKDEHIASLHRDVMRIQKKLIEAYEKILELQEQRDG